MPHDPSDLATALGSRICHDLASPLGALMAGLDLLEMSGRPSPELALMRESVEGARATLDLLRLAFGPAGAGEAIGAEALRALCAAPLAARPRLTLDWTLAEALPRPEARRLALALLCALHALPRGGTLRVAREGAALCLAARGEIAADPALWQGLGGTAPLPEPDPRRIEFALLAQALARDGARLTISHAGDTLRLALLPAGKD
ncbi:MAG: hypothetical protein CMN17_08270 [Roseovarius sp.]|nr:hypothetical protein [Roseovarius sp.]MBK44912.1 hypothetical protein [Roseovarius sp.]